MWIFQQVQKDNWKEKSVSFSPPQTKLLSEKVICLQNHIQKCFYTIGHWTKLEINQNLTLKKQSSAISKPYYISIKRSPGNAESTNNVDNMVPLQVHADEIMIFPHNSFKLLM